MKFNWLGILSLKQCMSEVDNVLLTVKEAAERLGCSQAAVYMAVKQERIPHVKMLGRIGLREEDVEKYSETLGRANGWTKRKRETTDKPT